jgi:LysR family transcriptional regulator, glycine cleavage system transcriptional activator
MRRLPPLAALRAFEAAARHLSFKRAAEELNVTPTAISHQVRLLEESLGKRLFERRVRHVVMTAEAQSLYCVLRDGFDAFARALDDIAARSPRAAVTVTATTAFTGKWLVPRVAAFRAVRPDIDLKLLATEDVNDLDAGAADLALRFSRHPDPRLVAEPLFVDRFAPVASPRLGLTAPSDLKSITLLHFDWRNNAADAPTWPRWLAEAKVQGVDGRAGLRFSDESHAIQAAIAGHGVGLLSLTLVADELGARTLVVPFGPEIESVTCYLMQSAQRPLSEAAAAVRQWLRSECATLGVAARP